MRPKEGSRLWGVRACLSGTIPVIGSARSLYGLLIVFLAVLIAAVCIFSVVNANGLQTAVDRRTKAYVSDVTFQMAQNIDAQLANVMQTLEMLTDSLVRIDGAEHRMDFLKQRAQMLGFTQLVLCDVEGGHLHRCFHA